MPLDLQYTLANDTPADASPPEANFSRIEQYVNQETVQRDGTVAMTAQLKLIGDPVSALDAAPKQYVDTFIPIAAILMFSGDVAPAGGKWALCNGADLEAALYPALFNVIGNKYGGSTGRFNLPNLSGRVPLGVSGTDLLGVTGGSRDTPVVSHTHAINHAHTGTTGNDSPDHTHPGINHKHQDDHYHDLGSNSNTTPELTAHNHTYGVRTDPSASGSSGLPMISNATGATTTRTTDTEGQLHQHNLAGNVVFKSQTYTLPGSGVLTSDHTALADRDLTTGLRSAPHTHAVTITTLTANDTAPVGSVAGTNVNMQPYLVINFIIRIA